MPRRNRRKPLELRSLPKDGSTFLGSQTVEGPSWTHGEPYVMRHIGSARAQKYYVCPGCNQNIPPGVAHIVAWPRDVGRQGDDRRHWHRHCWERR
ncbi:hypothetical protein QP943_04570 [Corynebacterium kefirresidentii]|uniref:hypothetical protein n=1 Tax=Corynebacterium TaxID=1716 RepID=UPI0009BA7D33|nr:MULTISPECIES: hypothetical protein [Corynebacterium]WKS52674.1 hypothetical protein NLL48_06880 [Corynebacterium tuberculostearicum]MCG7241296.1 hypothetical protein [Corynebacterium kefirresidentii]MCG7284132.1 hypothetical protein [Corynebacterium kefirresidentii]MCG7450238.1 hypothetical protein [Corynebacterium kefirresidentii]MCG7452021.1 hypothetical protein [Corynebacterium kefirresidentii]